MCKRAGDEWASVDKNGSDEEALLGENGVDDWFGAKEAARARGALIPKASRRWAKVKVAARMSAGAMDKKAAFFLMVSMTVRGEREDSTPSRTRLGDEEEGREREGMSSAHGGDEVWRRRTWRWPGFRSEKSAGRPE